VAKNRFVYSQGLAVVHQADPASQTPQRRRAELVCGTLPAVLDDPVSGSNVVQRKVAERMDDLVAKSSRNGERYAVDQSAGHGGRELRCVADVASERIEQVLTRGGLGRGRQL